MTEEQARPRRWWGWRPIAIGSGAAIAVVATLLAAGEPGPSEPRFQATIEDAAAPAKTAADPLMAELLRCRSLPAGSDDAACQEAWEVNRRRFMGESRSYVPSAPAGAAQGR